MTSKKQTHIQKQRNLFNSNLKRIETDTGLNAEQYKLLRFEEACMFLEIHIDRNTQQGNALYWQFTQCKLFWAWWNNEFNHHLYSFTKGIRGEIDLGECNEVLLEVKHTSEISNSFYNQQPLF